MPRDFQRKGITGETHKLRESRVSKKRVGRIASPDLKTQRELEFRLREMTNVEEKSETKEQRRQEREAEQE